MWKRVLLLIIGIAIVALHPVRFYLTREPNFTLFAFFPISSGFLCGLYARNFLKACFVGFLVSFGGSLVLAIIGLFTSEASLINWLIAIIEHGMLLSLFSIPAAVIGRALVYFFFASLLSNHFPFQIDKPKQS